MTPNRRTLNRQGDLDNDDRGHGMGIVIEYASRSGKPQWVAPPRFRWNYALFAKPDASAPAPDETFEMIFAKENAADESFNRWTINGVAFPTEDMFGKVLPATWHLRQGKRYRLSMRNASDDIHHPPSPPHFRADQSCRDLDSGCYEG